MSDSAEVAQLVEQWSEESRSLLIANLFRNSRLIPIFGRKEQWFRCSIVLECGGQVALVLEHRNVRVAIGSVRQIRRRRRPIIVKVISDVRRSPASRWADQGGVCPKAALAVDLSVSRASRWVCRGRRRKSRLRIAHAVRCRLGLDR